MPARVASITALPLRLPAVHAGDERALAHAIAVADLRVRAHLLECDLLRRIADIEQQPQPLFGQRSVAIERLHQIGGFADVAEQNPADQPPSRMMSFL